MTRTWEYGLTHPLHCPALPETRNCLWASEQSSNSHFLIHLTWLCDLGVLTLTTFSLSSLCWPSRYSTLYKGLGCFMCLSPGWVVLTTRHTAVMKASATCKNNTGVAGLIATCPARLTHTSHVLQDKVALMAKNPPANAGDIRDVGLIPGSGRSLEEGQFTLLKIFEDILKSHFLCQIWQSLILLGKFRSFIDIHIIDTQFKFIFMIPFFSICFICSIFFSLYFLAISCIENLLLASCYVHFVLWIFTWFAHF